MISTDFDIAATIGRDAATAFIVRHNVDADDPRWTCEDVDDAVFPESFSDALDRFPEYEADDISDAVHDGITDAYRRYA